MNTELWFGSALVAAGVLVLAIGPRLAWIPESADIPKSFFPTLGYAFVYAAIAAFLILGTTAVFIGVGLLLAASGIIRTILGHPFPIEISAVTVGIALTVGTIAARKVIFAAKVKKFRPPSRIYVWIGVYVAAIGIFAFALSSLLRLWV